jgi:hypothetical protein
MAFSNHTFLDISMIYLVTDQVMDGGARLRSFVGRSFIETLTFVGAGQFLMQPAEVEVGLGRNGPRQHLIGSCRERALSISR